MIKIKGTAKLFPPEGDVELSILAPLADYLSPEVRAITVDDDGLLAEVSTDPEEDDTMFMAYPPLSLCESLSNCRTVQYSKLQELDRLGPFVDLVSLPPHPNIVPFDRVVLAESRVIGFTTKYIPGETLANPNVPFRFEWLQQLTRLVDFLNLEYGIMHQDIAPRNLLIDHSTSKILLFDFDRAASGDKNLHNGQDDVNSVVFTLYELITNDTSFSGIPHWERNIDMVQSIPAWISYRKLDSEVSKFREYLNEWVATRRSDVDGDMQRYLNAPNRLRLPDLPTAPEYTVPFEMGTRDGKPVWRTGLRSRNIAMKLGQHCFRWERPPQNRLLRKNEDTVKLTDDGALSH
ncbi:hypothetical protein PDIG_27960 [Penicillium digitatum PHI26]|uniref:EKC/KEOPS complex subunit BUD32 n=2 Tax=Penicillium digitatum TaxID=36651 RepID=K9FZI2_PEND2|nr:hypothetical protein PDIP_62400 [Penicillium digitatum Pd1]EKV09908.1 hypothetical protein PDIP_62400 [Penicillium digitatum Pd1]EKV15115.1 hypothetical protein PDIG_27960 [Penicillium digitatum PHI26]KAG0157248.1 hypothetical protein PDIDSM_4433 [Penicillium digitatum]